MRIIKIQELEIEIDHRVLFKEVDLDSDVLPALVSGVVSGQERPASTQFAIAMNGRIEAVTQGFERNSDGQIHFSAMVPERAFQNGENHVETYIVEKDSSGELVLVKGTADSKDDETLLASTGSGQKVLVKTHDFSIPLPNPYSRGRVDAARITDGVIILAGWAADIENGRPADRVLVFDGNKLLYSAEPNMDRKDLVDAYQRASLLKSGFRYALPLTIFGCIAELDRRLSVVGVLDKGVEWELRYEHRALNALRQTAALDRRDCLRPPEIQITRDESGKKVLLSNDGDAIPVLPDVVKGFVDLVSDRDFSVIIGGWSADMKAVRPVETVLIAVEGRAVYSGSPSVMRSDVAEALADEAFLKTGFWFEVPSSVLDGPLESLHAYGITKDGVAGQLKFTGKGKRSLEAVLRRRKGRG